MLETAACVELCGVDDLVDGAFLDLRYILHAVYRTYSPLTAISSQEFSADEHSRNGLATAYQSLQSLLHSFAVVRSGTVVLLVQLIHCGIDAETAEEAFDHMTHTARAHAEDHYHVLGGMSLNPLQLTALICVDFCV